MTSSARVMIDGGIGGLEIDHQLEFGRLLDRQIGRLGAFGDAIDIIRGQTVHVGEAGAIGHQTALIDPLPKREYRRQPVVEHHRDEALAISEKDWRVHQQQSVPVSSLDASEGALVIVRRIGALNAIERDFQGPGSLSCGFELVGGEAVPQHNHTHQFGDRLSQ
jgi:hypothetical protein